MNKILAALALALSIATISCATLGENVVDPMKVVVAQVTSPEGPSRAESTALRVKVERMEKSLERQIENVDSLNYAKANHTHPAQNAARDHTHSQYLEKGFSTFDRDYANRDHTHFQYLEKSFSSFDGDYANRNHTHSQYLEKGISSFDGDYANRNHTHDYASRNHSHGGGFP